MGHILKNKELYEALSDLFIDNHVDILRIASVAKNYPINYVETILFRYVAPVCCFNLSETIPIFWFGFDLSVLEKEIIIMRKKEKFCFGRIKLSLGQMYYRFMLRKEWRKLKQAIENIKS